MNPAAAARQAPGEGAVDLAYEVAGQRGRPLLLLLIHGGTSSRRSWDLLTPALRASFRIVAVDLRGHGHSPAPDRGYSALQLSADVGRLADERELQGVSVVGHSLGGMVAIHLAAHRPDPRPAPRRVATDARRTRQGESPRRPRPSRQTPERAESRGRWECRPWSGARSSSTPGGCVL
ncbi:alpha/beta fold hydrolase [Thiomonas sp. FB-6]|uniref:alpha/beta fold hydrolase n=1 Tax=Thiomonas sp. FB-6 TaxID=1158291 RepID=UPI0009DB835B